MKLTTVVIVSLILVMAVGLGGCTTITSTEPKSAKGVLSPIQPEILDITITGYHNTHDTAGNYDPDRIEATLNWETNKPGYYCFEVRPVDFDYPTNSGGYEKFEVSAYLQEQVKHSWSIVLKSGKLHLYVLTVWDRQKNYITKSDTF